MKKQILLNHVEEIDGLYLEEILFTNDETVIESSNDIDIIVNAIDYLDELYLTGELGFYGRFRMLQDYDATYYLVERSI